MLKRPFGFPGERCPCAELDSDVSARALGVKFINLICKGEDSIMFLQGKVGREPAVGGRGLVGAEGGGVVNGV